MTDRFKRLFLRNFWTIQSAVCHGSMSVEKGIRQHINCSATSHKTLSFIYTYICKEIHIYIAEKAIGREYMAVWYREFEGERQIGWIYSQNGNICARTEMPGMSTTQRSIHPLIPLKSCHSPWRDIGNTCLIYLGDYFRMRCIMFFPLAVKGEKLSFRYPHLIKWITWQISRNYDLWPSRKKINK